MAKKSPKKSFIPAPNTEIDVFEVEKAEIDLFTGRNWDEIVLERPSAVHQTLYNAFLFASEGRTPPDNGQRYLPWGSAWLREIDGRAYLYKQNW